METLGIGVGELAAITTACGVSFVCLVLVAVVGLGILRAIRLQRKMGAAFAMPASAQAQRWAHCAYSLWTGGEDCGQWEQGRAQQALRDWYGATDTAGLMKTVGELREGTTGSAAWDQVRALDLLRIGFAAGYLRDDQCWAIVREIAADLRKSYGSWEELGAAFEAGMHRWQDSRDNHDPQQRDRVQRNLVTLRAHVWPITDWNAQL